MIVNVYVKWFLEDSLSHWQLYNILFIDKSYIRIDINKNVPIVHGCPTLFYINIDEQKIVSVTLKIKEVVFCSINTH